MSQADLMFPHPPPPFRNAHTDVRTTLKPYLQLPHILSLTWLAYPVISLVFVIFRLQISSQEAQSSVANAKNDLLAACQAAERAATAAASMPRYMAIACNHQFADSVNGTMNGAREALILALTCMEAIINFLISIYRSTFLCFLELVVVGGLDLLISAVQEITSFLQSTLNGIVSGLKNDATSLNSAIQSAVNSINSVNPFGKIQAPQFNVSSLDALSNVTIPTDFETALIHLNNSLPSVSSIKDTIEDLVDTPFEVVKADINNTFLGLTLDPMLLPVPTQNAVSFCSDFDTSSIDNLGNDLLRITKIGTMILIAVLFLLLAAHCVFEWYKWGCLIRHLRFTREAWVSDPTTNHTSSKITPSVTLTDHNLLMLQCDAQHPLLTRIAYMLAAQLHLAPSQHIHLRWFLHYIFHPPALACFLIGFFGLLSVQIQLIAIGPLEAQYNTQVIATVQDLSNAIATQMNNSMYNQSAAYANGINIKVETVQSTINNGLFGWVNGTTTTLNSTLNNFYTDIQDLVGTLFNGTILETPAQDFVKCLIGSKVNAIEEALTFLNQNLNVDLPRVNETVLVLSPTSVNEITQPIATAATGGTSSNSQGLVGRLVATYVDSLKRERLMFSIFMGLWVVVVLMGIAIVFWHSYCKNLVDAYKRRKWQKEQRDGLEGFVMSFGEGAAPPHKRDTEKGDSSLLDPPLLRSFTPLPEPTRSPFGVNLFRRPNQQGLPSSNHPLKSLEPTFEKSWDSFFRREGEDNKHLEMDEPVRPVISRPMKLMDFGKKKPSGGEVLAPPEGDRSDDKLKTTWFKPVTGWFSKGSVQPTSEFVVTGNRQPALTSRPQLTISVEQASAATPRNFPKIERTSFLVREERSSSPIRPWMKNIPPKKAMPLTVLPPPPVSQPNVPGNVGSNPAIHGPFAMPLYNAFEERLPSQTPVRALHPHPGGGHKRSSTVPLPITPPLAAPVSRHGLNGSMPRLLINMHAQCPDESTTNPFATPFDDDAGVVGPSKPKRITNPFAGTVL